MLSTGEGIRTPKQLSHLILSQAPVPFGYARVVHLTRFELVEPASLVQYVFRSITGAYTQPELNR